MPNPASSSTRRPCIGVFDSGFGGLTVLRELLRELPGADYFYLGDSARLPYGSKSAETVTRYTAAAVRYLRERGAELVVIACNTASALALPGLIHDTPIPLVGVIGPGANAASQALAGKDRPVLVLATEATVASHAYTHACRRLGIRAIEKACPLLVPLIEEGWTEHPVTAQVADIYLEQGISGDRPGAVLLGCTHYPLLRPLLEERVGRLLGPVPVVDSAEATARHVRTLLPQAAQLTSVSILRCFATDSVEKFQRLGERFLGQAIGTVSHIDLES